MTYKNLNFFLIFLLVNKVVNGQEFFPEPRAGPTATLLGGKIYFIGGDNRNADTTSDFFYLNMNNLSWVDLNSQGVKFPYTGWHTSDIGGANKDSIFIIGGYQLETTNLVYKFDIKTNAITAPVIQGKEPPRRRDLKSVSYAGKIYIFSGNEFNSIKNNNTFFNNFDVLDTVNMTWNVGSLANAPLPRFFYTATLVNGVIYYIGGIQQNGTGQTYASMTDISQYDINENTWSLKIATGVKPGIRAGHSATLIYDKICIYGGIFNSTSTPAVQQIAMLDTNTLRWSIPSVQDPNNIPSLVFHTATQYGTNMILAFGNITHISVGGVINNNFYIFDLGEPNITWSSITARLAPPSSPSSPVSLTTKSTGVIPTGVIVGLTVGLVIAGIVVFSLVYIYRKKKIENEVASAAGHPGGGDITYSSKFAPTTLQYHYSNSQEDLTL